MANKTLLKYQVLKESGAIFADGFTTDYVELTNSKNVDFIIATGVGTAANTTLKVKAKLGPDGLPVAIPFKEKIGQTTYNQIDENGKTFEIGGTAGECGFIVVTIDADFLKGKYDRVAIDTTIVADSTVPGTIIACIYDPRYSE